MIRILAALAALVVLAGAVRAQGCTGGFAYPGGYTYVPPYGFAPQGYGSGVGPAGNAYQYSYAPQGYGYPSQIPGFAPQGYGSGVGPFGNQYQYSFGPQAGGASTLPSFPVAQQGPLYVPTGDGRFEVYVRSPSGSQLNFTGAPPVYRPPYGGPPTLYTGGQQYAVPPSVVGTQSSCPSGL